jgi:histidinol-phosphate aminotransferase
MKNLIRNNIKNLQPYACARDEYKGDEGVFLDANENPFGENNRYPDPYQKELKAELAKIKNVESDQIFIGNGSDEVIDLLYRIFCNPGKDKVIVFTPTYGMYEVSAGINDVEVIKIPLTADFQIEKGSYEAYLNDETIKVMFICSPNNPTGNSIDNNVIEDILKRFKGIVFIDEAYIDFSTKDSWLKRLNEFQNLIISQTFSKAWGLAAIRVGIAYSNQEIISYYNKVKPPYNVSKLNQECALEALKNSQQQQAEISLILEERTKLIEALKTLKNVVKIYPSDANFLLIEFQDGNAMYSDLIERKIITRNRNSVMKNTVRISIGTKEENEKLIKEIIGLSEVEVKI